MDLNLIFGFGNGSFDGFRASLSWVFFYLRMLGLGFFLILPLAAQDQKSAPAAVAIETKQTPLAQGEHEQLALALMQAQAARISLLEALAAKRAGTDDLSEADQASRAYTALLQSLAKKHDACEGGQWNFLEKKWMCAPK